MDITVTIPLELAEELERSSRAARKALGVYAPYVEIPFSHEQMAELRQAVVEIGGIGTTPESLCYGAVVAFLAGRKKLTWAEMTGEMEDTPQF